MENITVVNVKSMKEAIKNMASYQKFLKNQRKTVNLVGERVIEPYEATCKHADHREQLRLMYAAYGLARGKSFSQIENNHKEGEHPLDQFADRINKYIRMYEMKGEEVYEV
jgi:hypothetical protein